jgi:hypothetical protein
MNFERHTNLSPSTLNVGKTFLKREKIQSLMRREILNRQDIVFGLGEIISLMLHSKDVEIIEIFKNDFLQYFAIHERSEEGWRWIPILRNLSEFPKKDQIKVRDLIIDIHDQISLA